MESDDMIVEFARRLRQAREAKEMSQRDLGKATGINHSLIGKYERGGVDPSITNVAKLARYLDVDAGWLMAWDRKPATEETVRAAIRAAIQNNPAASTMPTEKLMEAAMPIAIAIAENLEKIRNE